MGKTSNLDSFLENKDKNGVKVASWAKKRKPGLAFCTVCQCEVNFAQGSRCLTNHSQREKHITQARELGQSNLVQLTVAEAMAGRVNCDNKEKDVPQPKSRKAPNSATVGAYSRPFHSK